MKDVKKIRKVLREWGIVGAFAVGAFITLAISIVVICYLFGELPL